MYSKSIFSSQTQFSFYVSCFHCITKYFITLWERREERGREKIGRVRGEDRNSWGCVGSALTTGMHEEAASIPQASGWFRDTTERTAQQPTCKSACLPHPRLFWALLPLWWLSLSNHTNKAWHRKTWGIEASDEEGEEMHCLLFVLTFIASYHHMIFKLIYGTAASPKQRHPAAVYNMVTMSSPALMFKE